MSKYEWEHGTIKIPAKDYPKLRKAVITKYNELQDKKLLIALRNHAKIMDAKKGKRGFDTRKLAWDLCSDNDVMNLLFVYDHEKRQYKLRKPKKRDLKKKPTTKDCTLDIGEASITFNNKTRTVTWDVPENNRACERAREAPLAKFFFDRLDGINWTRGSGGTIVGNDEYNREADYEGGGANYVTSEYPGVSPERWEKLTKQGNRARNKFLKQWW
jgi:hypothetical protein